VLAVTVCLVALPVAARAQSAAADSANKDTDFEFRAGGYLLNGERNSNFNNSLATGTGNVQGIEVLLRGGGVGLYGKSIMGSFGGGQPDVISADANLLLGVPEFSLMGGYGRRALKSSLGTQVYSYFRGGAMMSFIIGGSGLKATLNGAGYVPQDASTMKIGGEGEGSIIYSPPQFPVYVQFGYRTEVFTTKTSTVSAPEEVRGLRIGGGILFGGH
jgi:hypothetical protein